LLSHGLYSVYSGKHNKTCFAVAACCLLPAAALQCSQQCSPHMYLHH